MKLDLSMSWKLLRSCWLIGCEDYSLHERLAVSGKV
jgi:hypothetical protein